MEPTTEIITQSQTFGEQLARQLGPETLKLGNGLADLASHLPPLPPEIQPYVEWVQSLLNGNLSLLHTADGHVILAGIGIVAVGCIVAGLHSLAPRHPETSDSFQLSPDSIPYGSHHSAARAAAEARGRGDRVSEMIQQATNQIKGNRH